MNWKEQIVLFLLGGPFLITKAYVDYLRLPKGAPWISHVEYLILGLGGSTFLWGAVDAFRKRNDRQFIMRVKARSRDQAFGWLVITGLIAVPFFWPRPFWTRPLTYGSFVGLGLIVFFGRHAILCYRAPVSAVKGAISPLRVLLFGIGMTVLASIGTYLFPPIELLQSQWTEMRVFGFAGSFFRSLAGAIGGVLFLSAALFLGLRLVWDARNSRRQP